MLECGERARGAPEEGRCWPKTGEQGWGKGEPGRVVWEEPAEAAWNLCPVELWG